MNVTPGLRAERTTARTAAVAIVSGVVLAAWLIGTCKAALSGLYLPPTSGPPPVGVQLTVALAGLTVCLAVSPSLRSLLTNQQNLIRLNVWRLVGAVFVALMFTRQMPALWALPARLGDVAIGATAFWVAGRLDEPEGVRRAVIFNVLGLLDLVVAVGLRVTISPGPTQLFHLMPSGEVPTHFPLVLVPGVLGQGLPVGLSPDVTQAAMSTLGGAVAMSPQLPAPVDAALVDVARDAFLCGLVLCAAISGVGSLALAILAGWTFRGASVLPQRTAEHHAQVVA